MGLRYDIFVRWRSATSRNNSYEYEELFLVARNGIFHNSSCQQISNRIIDSIETVKNTTCGISLLELG